MMRWLMRWLGYVPYSAWEAQYHRAEQAEDDAEYWRNQLRDRSNVFNG